MNMTKKSNSFGWEKIIFKIGYNSHEDNICTNNIVSNEKWYKDRKQKKEVKNTIFSSDNNIDNKDKVNFDDFMEDNGNFIIKMLKKLILKTKTI